jgi:hypothetical protein
VFAVVSEDGFAAVAGLGMFVSLKDPDHELDLPIKR